MTQTMRKTRAIAHKTVRMILKISFFVSIILSLRCFTGHWNVLRSVQCYQLPAMLAIISFHTLRQPYMAATVQAASTIMPNVDMDSAHRSMKAASWALAKRKVRRGETGSSSNCE